MHFNNQFVVESNSGKAHTEYITFIILKSISKNIDYYLFIYH